MNSTVQGLRQRLLNSQDLAREWGCSARTVRNMVRRGSIPAVKIPGSRALRFRPESVDRLIDQFETTGNVKTVKAMNDREQRIKTAGRHLAEARRITELATRLQGYPEHAQVAADILEGASRLSSAARALEQNAMATADLSPVRVAIKASVLALENDDQDVRAIAAEILSRIDGLGSRTFATTQKQA